MPSLGLFSLCLFVLNADMLVVLLSYYFFIIPHNSLSFLVRDRKGIVSDGRESGE